MAIDKMKMKVLTKLFDAGYTDEKTILAIGITELVALRMTADENLAFNELQNSIKKNKVISYLAGTQEVPTKKETSNTSYAEY